MPDKINDQELENVAGGSMHYEADHRLGLLSHVYYQPNSGEKIKAQIDKTGTACIGKREWGKPCYKIVVKSYGINAWYFEPSNDTFSEKDIVNNREYTVFVDQS